MTADNQQAFVVLRIQNKLSRKAAELPNSGNCMSCTDIKNVLESHFGLSTNSSALIQNLKEGGRCLTNRR